MGYLHIDNLYKPCAQDILLFKECYALEKIHGTSAHISIDLNDRSPNGVKLFSGGISHQIFIDLIRDIVINNAQQNFDELPESFTVYGELYGGSCQKMSNTYGKEIKFIAFDVKVGDCWLDVPNAEDICKKLGVEFVSYVKIPADIETINAERDKPSIQAERNGMGNDKKREGVVLRPLIELTKNNGKRLICKHKADGYEETKTKREVSPEQLKVLSNAKEIAEEWVTEMRLIHVLDKLDGEKDMTIMPALIPAMIEDIKREGEGEIEWSKEVSTAIVREASKKMKAMLNKVVV